MNYYYYSDIVGLQDAVEPDPFAGLSDEPDASSSAVPPSAVHNPAPIIPPVAPTFQVPPNISPAGTPPALTPPPQYQPPPKQSYAHVPPKTYTAPPHSYSDPRVKDAMEYAEFAVAAMKVHTLCVCLFIYFSSIILSKPCSETI